MKITIITTALLSFILMLSQAFASPNQDVLDEITIRVLNHEHMSSSVTEIALPNIAGDHSGNRPDAADNANEHADLGAENAADAGENSGGHAGGNAGGNAGENSGGHAGPKN